MRKVVEAVKANRVASVSVTSIVAAAVFLMSQGWNPLDTIVTYSSAYQALEVQVADLQKITAHCPHTQSNVNDLLLWKFEDGEITVKQYTDRAHKLTHDDVEGP